MVLLERGEAGGERVTDPPCVSNNTVQSEGDMKTTEDNQRAKPTRA